VTVASVDDRPRITWLLQSRETATAISRSGAGSAFQRRGCEAGPVRGRESRQWGGGKGEVWPTGATQSIQGNFLPEPGMPQLPPVRTVLGMNHAEHSLRVPPACHTSRRTPGGSGIMLGNSLPVELDVGRPLAQHIFHTKCRVIGERGGPWRNIHIAHLFERRIPSPPLSSPPLPRSPCSSTELTFLDATRLFRVPMLVT